LDSANWQLLQAVALGSLVPGRAVCAFTWWFHPGDGRPPGLPLASARAGHPLPPLRHRRRGNPARRRVPGRQGAGRGQRLGRGAHLHPDSAGALLAAGAAGNDLTALTVAAGSWAARSRGNAFREGRRPRRHQHLARALLELDRVVHEEAMVVAASGWRSTTP